MWQIFIFIEQKYLYRANILFIQQTKQIFFIGEKELWSKSHGLKISWDEFFMVQNFMGSKSWD
jgi:hypothetical protein